MKVRLAVIVGQGGDWVVAGAGGEHCRTSDFPDLDEEDPQAAPDPLLVADRWSLLGDVVPPYCVTWVTLDVDIPKEESCRTWISEECEVEVE
jgi:hypothetical protein